MAVDSMVPRMNGSRPYWPWVGFHVLPKIQENAERREGRPGLDDDGDQEPDRQGAPNRTATIASIPL